MIRRVHHNMYFLLDLVYFNEPLKSNKQWHNQQQKLNIYSNNNSYQQSYIGKKNII